MGPNFGQNHFTPSVFGKGGPKENQMLNNKCMPRLFAFCYYLILVINFLVISHGKFWYFPTKIGENGFLYAKVWW